MFVASSTRHPAAELEVVLLLHDKHALRHAVAEALGRVLDKFDIDVRTSFWVCGKLGCLLSGGFRALQL